MGTFDLAKRHLDNATASVEQGKLYKAMREFDRAIELHYGWSEALAGYGATLVRAGRYQQAVEKFLQSTQFDPTRPLNVDALSESLDHDIQQVADVEAFQKVIDEANNAELFDSWGRVLVRLSRHEQAIQQFAKALSANPELNLSSEALSTALKECDSTASQVKSLQEIVDEQHCASAWNTWGNTLTALGQYSSAIKQFNKAIEADDLLLEPRANLGEAYFRTGNYRMAINVLLEALERKANHSRMYQLVGEAYIKQSQHPEAVAIFQQAMEKAPSAAYITPWQTAIRGLPDPVPAITEFQEILERGATSWKGNEKWCQFLLSRGLVAYAAVYYGRLIAGAPAWDPGGRQTLSRLKKSLTSLLSEPGQEHLAALLQNEFETINTAQAFLRWGNVLALSNERGLALEQLSLALKLLSDDGSGWPWDDCMQLVKALPTSEMRLEAVRRIDVVVAGRNTGVLWVDWGQVLLRSEYAQRALDAYGRALLTDASDPKLQFEQLIRGFREALKTLSDRETAIKRIQEDVDRVANPKTYHSWGRVLHALGREQSAIVQYQHAVRLKPDFDEAISAIADEYVEQGRYHEACRLLQKVVAKEPNNADALFAWGTALSRSGSHEEAVQKYAQAIRVDPDKLVSLGQQKRLVKWDDEHVIRRVGVVVREINTSKSYVAWGILLASLGHHETAIKQYRRSVELNPDNQVAYGHWRKAIGKVKNTQVRETLMTEYQDVIEQYPDNAESFCQWADFQLSLRQSERAVANYKKALEKDPKHANARAGQIYYFFNADNYEQARQEALRLTSNNPSHFYSYFCLAWMAHTDGDYDEAIRQSKLGIERAGANLGLYSRWGWALYEKGMLENAAQIFEEAISQNQSDPAPYYEYGNYLYELKRYEDAANQYRRAIDKNPGYVYAHHNFAAIASDQGQYEEAWGRWMNALDVYSRAQPAIDRVVDHNEHVDSNEYSYYAQVTQGLLRRSNEAEAILQAGLNFDPENTLILSSLTEVLWERAQECLGEGREVTLAKQKYHWQAMSYFQRAERLLNARRKNHAHYYNLMELGNLHLTVEQYGKAHEYFEEARSKDTTDPVACTRLGVTWLKQKQQDKAIPLLQEALRLAPGDLDVMSNLAEAYLRAEKLGDAESVYREILILAPNHVQSLIGLGEVCLNVGDKDNKKDVDRLHEAIKYYDRAIDVAGNEKIRSKYLKKAEEVAIYYSRGYARVQIFENSGLRRDPTMLKQALQDFNNCRQKDPTHQKAVRAIDKIQAQITPNVAQRLSDSIGPMVIFVASAVIFLIVQLAYFLVPLLNRPTLVVTESSLRAMTEQFPEGVVTKLESLRGKQFANEEAMLLALQALVDESELDKVKEQLMPNAITTNALAFFPKIDGATYLALTFGLLLLMIAALYLPQISKLKGAGIELEKSSIDQARNVGTLGISK